MRGLCLTVLWWCLSACERLFSRLAVCSGVVWGQAISECCSFLWFGSGDDAEDDAVGVDDGDGAFVELDVERGSDQVGADVDPDVADRDVAGNAHLPVGFPHGGSRHRG